MKLSILTPTSFLVLLSSLSIGGAPFHAIPALATEIPDALKIPEGQTLLLKSMAKGSQIYVCQLTAHDPSGYNYTPDRYDWELKAPDAALFDEQGLQKGKHYLGPTWEWQDGSQVKGKVKAKADAPDSQAIPWLLLEAKGTKREPAGVLSPVKWVQRLNTVGGKAPQSGCDRTNQNKEVRVNYTADYYFYGDKP
jgi:hypothetical protein